MWTWGRRAWSSRLLGPLMLGGRCFGLSRGWLLIEEVRLGEVSLIFLEGGINSTDVNLPPLLKNLHPFVADGWNCFVLVDLGSPQQDVVGQGPTINEVELVHCPRWSYGKLKINVIESERGRTFTSETRLGCL